MQNTPPNSEDWEEGVRLLSLCEWTESSPSIWLMAIYKDTKLINDNECAKSEDSFLVSSLVLKCYEL